MNKTNAPNEATCTHRWRFSLLSLLGCVSALCVLCAWYAFQYNRMQEESDALVEIHKMLGTEPKDIGYEGFAGLQYVTDVSIVDVGISADMIAPIADQLRRLTHLRAVIVDNVHVDMTTRTELQRQLPDAEVWVRGSTIH